MTSQRVKDEIVAVLHELGGEVHDVDGAATRLIFERMASTGTYSTVSYAVKELESEGVVVRDMPNLKRTTRIALAGEGVRPGLKDLSVVMEEVSRDMAVRVERQLQTVIDAHVAYALEQRGDPEALREELEVAQNEIRALRGQLRDTQRTPALLQAELDQVKAELARAEEQRTIAEHNAEVWKTNALKRPVVREMLSAVKDRLDPKTRVELEKLMRELPAGR